MPYYWGFRAKSRVWLFFLAGFTNDNMVAFANLTSNRRTDRSRFDRSWYWGALVVSIVTVGRADIALSATPAVSGETTETERLAQIGSRSLGFGDRGPDVVELQLRLRDLDYFKEQVTGFFGVVTEAAVRQFQQQYNLPADGVVGSDTWIVLFEVSPPPRERPVFPPPTWLYFENPTLRPGDRGDFVLTLQSALNEIGFGPIREDRFYGLQTESAVRNFQRFYRVPASIPGQVDDLTAEVLEGVLDGSIAIVGLPYEVTLRRGDEGFEVLELQRVLAETPKKNDDDEFYYDGEPNGVFDRKTERAVREYQRDRDLAQTGEANERTLRSLFSQYRYVVIVPLRSNTSVSEYINYVRGAIESVDDLNDLEAQDLRFYDDRRGPYIDVGWYRDRSSAQSRANDLRREGLPNVRVAYFDDPFDRVRLSRAELEARY
ncbi:MAG: peptidoglycan-binding protein [Cyanobacteria bacterium SID2]|nr:peptidoglycan-binding protein [Cyanobacteria bacterium SID2]